MLKIVDLRCEHAPHPLGIDVPRPRFSWKLEHHERGQAQTAYQIQVASSPDHLAAGHGDLWDSGKTPAGLLPLIQYAGIPLVSRQRVWWRVRAWDEQDRPSAYSEPTGFEMGLLHAEDWLAQWIGFPAGWNGKALYFRQQFEVEQPIVAARMYLCGLGWHELRLNGQKVGESVLEPAQTDFGKRALYSTYDVGGLLRPGANGIGVIVGHGWYGTPKLIAQLEMQLGDGSTQRVITGRWNAGGSWWQVSDGPLLANSVYDGEVYDARLERPGWDTPGTVMDNWAGAMVTDGPGGRLVSAMLEPVQVVERRQAASVSQPKPGIFVYDTGQNLAGWARLTAQGERGTTITLRFAESLYDDGTVNQENLRSARARDRYILKGEGVESWEPRFTYHGFRYVQVEGYPGQPTLDSIQIAVVRSAVASTGQFDCDHPLINRIHQAVWWTEASNLHGLPTDCPQRDERMGWLNDMAARSEEAILNFDLARLLRKWLYDIADTQDEAGAIADTAPFRWGSRPGDPVIVCYVLIPWLLYTYYGDTGPMTDHYDGMRRWVDYLTSRSEQHIVTYGHFGDWAPPIAEGLAGSIGSSAVAYKTPAPLVSTAYYAYATWLMAQMAAVLGHGADAAVYHAQFAQIQAAFNDRFWDEAAGGYGSNNQACNTLALYMGLVPQDRRARTLASLIRDIEEHEGHLTTGNLTTKYILEVLTEAGRGDLAFRLATQTSYPSWGYMLEHGATTIWERWEQATGGGMNSHNHGMYGSIGAWFYRALAGLRVNSDRPAFGHFVIAPPLLAGLTRASATLHTVRGVIASAWERDANSFGLHTRIPVGSQAEIRLPRLSDTESARLMEGDSLIWSGGQPMADVPGIVEIHEAADHIRLLVGSGDYTFRLEAVP